MSRKFDLQEPFSLFGMSWADIPPSARSFLAAQSTLTIVLFGVVVVPVAFVLLNALRQVVVPRRKSTPPMVFHWIPWFGSAADYGQAPYEFFFRNREKYGDLFSFRLLGKTVTVALGPKGNNLSLGGKTSQVCAEDVYTSLTTPVFGKGVVYDCPNDMLMQQKKFIKHGLSTEAFQSYAPMIWNETARYFQQELKLGAGDKPASFEVFYKFSQLIIFTASRTLLGREVRGIMGMETSKLMHDLDGGFVPMNMMFTNVPLPMNRRRDKAQRAFSDMFLRIIEKRKSGESDNTEHDMIQALLGCEYRNGVPLTDRDIAHMMIAILMAGQHTSSATISWTVLHLAHRADIYEQLYREHEKLFRNADGSYRDITMEDTKQMPLMDSCIRETLRMHAPLHSLLRAVISDIPVPASLSAPGENENYVIPKGNLMLAAPGVSAMDPLIWDSPAEWRPSRWSDEAGTAQSAQQQYESGEKVDYGFGSVSKGTESPYQPFGAGRHRCVGESFAYLQLSIIISYIVRNYTLKLNSKNVPQANFTTMIVQPLNGIVIFTPRKETA